MEQTKQDVCISRDAALAAIGALSVLERTFGIDEATKAALREIMDALATAGKKPH